jgi:hypothetical protein
MTRSTRHFDQTLPYRVVPLRPERTEAAIRLEMAIRRGFTAVEDPRRHGFYTVRVDGIFYYFHVFEKNGTAYLVAASERPDASNDSVSASAQTTTH